jgi:hypothetical protein
MGCYYYNCLMCGQGFMEDRAFHDNTVVCPNCQCWGSDPMVVDGRKVPQAVRVSFRCQEKLDWKNANKDDPSTAFGRSVGIATNEQIAEYLEISRDPYFAATNGVTKLKLPVQDPPYNTIHWEEAVDLPPEKDGSEPPEGYMEEFDEIGADYKATEKLLRLVKGE